MVKHISVFFIKEQANGNSKKENIEYIKDLLNAIPDKMDKIVNCIVGKNIAETPDLGIKEGPEFGDLIQILDFETFEDAKAYPTHVSHIDLLIKTKDLMEKVVAIDIEIK